MSCFIWWLITGLTVFQCFFQESNSFETTQPEDKFSDTSEEITASDSGKGGSEDDLSTHAHGKALIK